MTAIFRDRRRPGERRTQRALAGRIHCRRRTSERRRYTAKLGGNRWWLKTNYVDRELTIEKTLP